jgi:hypothetical protein
LTLDPDARRIPEGARKANVAGRSLIVRVLTGVVRPERSATFRDQATLALRGARQCDGLVFGTVWRDLNCLYRWVGGNDLMATPLLRDKDGGILDDIQIQHYEVLDPSPASDALTSEPAATGF